MGLLSVQVVAQGMLLPRDCWVRRMASIQTSPILTMLSLSKLLLLSVQHQWGYLDTTCWGLLAW